VDLKSWAGQEASWSEIAQRHITGELSNEDIIGILCNDNFETREQNHIKFKTEYQRQIKLSQHRLDMIGNALETGDMTTVYQVLNSIQSEREGDLIRREFENRLKEHGLKEQSFSDYIEEKLTAHYEKKEKPLSDDLKNHIVRTIEGLDGFNADRTTAQLTEALRKLPSQYRTSGTGDSAVGVAAGAFIGTSVIGHLRGLSLGSGFIGLGSGVLAGAVMTGVMREWDQVGNDNWYRDIERLTAGLSESQKQAIRERFDGIEVIPEELEEQIRMSLKNSTEESAISQESIATTAKETLDKLQGDTLSKAEKTQMIYELAQKLQTDLTVNGDTAKDIFDIQINELLKKQEDKASLYDLIANNTEITKEKAKDIFQDSFKPDSIASAILQEAAVLSQALRQLETTIGEIDSEKEKEAKEKWIELNKKDSEIQLTEDDKNNLYLQREDVEKKLETIVDRYLLGRHEEAIVTNISLSKSQQGKVLESLEKKLSEHKSLNSNLDWTMEDRVSIAFYDREKQAIVSIDIIPNWNNPNWTPVGANLRDPQKSWQLFVP